MMVLGTRQPIRSTSTGPVSKVLWLPAGRRGLQVGTGMSAFWRRRVFPMQETGACGRGNSRLPREGAGGGWARGLGGHSGGKELPGVGGKGGPRWAVTSLVSAKQQGQRQEEPSVCQERTEKCRAAAATG